MQLGSLCGMGRIAWVAGLPGVVLATAVDRVDAARDGRRRDRGHQRERPDRVASERRVPRAQRGTTFTATVPGSETVISKGMTRGRSGDL